VQDCPDRASVSSWASENRDFLNQMDFLFASGLKPGKTASPEANRRIKYFVDSMFQVRVVVVVVMMMMMRVGVIVVVGVVGGAQRGNLGMKF
jgi:hypothetical protein